MHYRRLIFPVAACLLTAAGTAAETSVVQAEYAFNRAVAEHGIRDGFLMFLDKDAVMFAPRPVNAYQTYFAQKPGHDKLVWYPAFARVSASGDLAFTTGPWVYTTGKGGKLFGDYVTIWRQMPDTGWRVMLDCGVSHPRPPADVAALPEAAPAAVAGVTPASPGSDWLRRADTRYSALAARRGSPAAFARFAAASARFLRMGAQAKVGKAAAGAGRAAHAPDVVLNWTPLRAIASSAGDLGYTYGYRWGRSDIGQRHPYAVYLHVWQRTASGASLLVDLERPLPRSTGK